MAKAERQSSKSVSVRQLQNQVAEFVSERDWEQFHAPRNLAMAISVESAELLDLFKWSADDDGIEELLPGLRDEIADVMIYCLSLCNLLDLDASAIVEAKLSKNKAKYPVDRYKGQWR
jgi:NTP pyrophosphatase (non-canonical NTP hydrolase)